ncbi:MAG: tetratricopeptide repeat protein [Gemmataceae bacterium]
MHESIASDRVSPATDIGKHVTQTGTPTPPMVLALPAAPPGYEILDIVGEGGMGTVYAARDIALDRSVALKFLQTRYGTSEIAARRFLYEARVTARLQHPGIPPVHQVGTLPDGRPFLAMKLIHGQTLDRLLREQESGAARWLGVFDAICQAVGYAHSQGVIHRDLKPANIMVGAFGEVQVMDWGLAKLLGREAHEALPETGALTAGLDPEATTAEASTQENQTQAGTILGTPPYMPPEQAIGAINRLDCRSDVFGLGAILCTLLTGKPPYQGANGEAVRQLAARCKLDDAFARLDACGAEPDLVALAKRCLAFEPEERPADAGRLATAVGELRRAAEDRARAAELERAQAELRAAEQRKRRRLLLLAGCGLMLVLSGGIVGTTREYWRAEAARQNEQEQREQAEESRDQAKQRYLLALDAFNDMVFGIQNKLETQPGTLALRKELLGKARLGLGKLLAEAERQGNPDSTLVWAHFRMGDTEKILGNIEAARQQYQAGHDLARRLVEANPDSLRAQRDLSVSYSKLGDVSLQLGQTKEALRFYQQGLEIGQRLARDDPRNAEAQRDLGVIYDRLGDVSRQLGQTKEALGFYLQDLEISQRLARDDPRNVQAQRDLGISYDRLGDVSLQLGQTKEALGFYLQGLEIGQRLARDDPRNAQAQRDLSVSYSNLGTVSLQLGQTKEALEFYQQGLEIRQRLARGDHRNAQAQRDLSVSYNKLGDVSLQLGQTKEALGFYQQDLEISQLLARDDPRNAQAQRDLGVSYSNLGDVNLRLGQTKEALGCFQQDLEIRQRLARDDPRNAQTQRDLGVSYEKLGEVSLRLSQTKEALGFYQQSLEIRQRLARDDPRNAQAQQDLFISFYKMAAITMVGHKYEVATHWLEQAQALLDELHKRGLIGGPQEMIGTWTVQQWQDDLRRRLDLCQMATQVLARMAFAFAQKPKQVGELLDLRIRALLHRKRIDDAIKTAECWRDWAAQLTTNRDAHRYDVACAFALCAAADRGTRREVLVRQCVALLKQLRESGYFREEKRRVHFAQDADFAALREHPLMVEFTASLAKQG